MFLKFFERKSDAYDALLGIGMQTAANIAVTPELALKCVPVPLSSRAATRAVLGPGGPAPPNNLAPDRESQLPQGAAEAERLDFNAGA